MSMCLRLQKASPLILYAEGIGTENVAMERKWNKDQSYRPKGSVQIPFPK